MHCDALALLVVTAARYVLGVENAATLRQAADRALDCGFYTEALGQLAMEFHSESLVADAGPIFERALAQLGLSLPSHADAVWVALRHAIGRIARGEVPPRAGLRIVYVIYENAHLNKESRGTVGDSHELQKLLGAFYGYDDLEGRPDEVSFEGRYGEEAIAALDAAVLADAKEWAARHGA